MSKILNVCDISKNENYMYLLSLSLSFVTAYIGSIYEEFSSWKFEGGVGNIGNKIERSVCPNW